MTLITGTNKQDGPCVVLMAKKANSFDMVYGPFPTVADATLFIVSNAGDMDLDQDDPSILMLDQSRIKADVILQTGVPTHDDVCKIAQAMFPHGFTTQDNDMGEIMIRTGLRFPDDPDLEDGPLERCYDDAGAELPVDRSWEEREAKAARPPIVTLDLKSAVDACLDIANEVFPGGKLEAVEAPDDDIEMFLNEIEATPVEKNASRYTDDVRLAAWAMLAEAGNETNASVKPLDEITEADMDAWWTQLQS